MTAISDVDVNVVRAMPRGADVLGIPVAEAGPVPRSVGVSRAVLDANGFEGKVAQTLVIPRAGATTVVAVGVGDPDALDRDGLRDAAAALARAASKHSHVATSLTDLAHIPAEEAAEIVTEAILLATYRYVGLKNDTSGARRLEQLTLVAGGNREAAAARGARKAQVVATATELARDLANTPPAHLNARDIADRAVELAAASGLDVEVFNADDLRRLGCGGLLGVNKASAEPPRMVKLTYQPRRPKQHIALVGKGVMYDSGGISLKPSDPMHAMMKMDMSGAAAVLATMTALAAVGGRNKVTAYLMCTDNMPSGSALKLGDVLTIHNGTTVEIHNTDAEGRLILADGLSLAVEEEPDAVIDIATLTGAALVALGDRIAGLIGNDGDLVDRVRASAAKVGEPVWELPLAKEHYRKMLDSNVADIKNIGNRNAGTITAAIFLSEFVGDVPWAHLDIAGTMNVDADSGVYSKGATGFGTRLLIDLVSA
jgi:leucyl aminopeptidase